MPVNTFKCDFSHNINLRTKRKERDALSSSGEDRLTIVTYVIFKIALHLITYNSYY
jgi:hypothetical protein